MSVDGKKIDRSVFSKKEIMELLSLRGKEQVNLLVSARKATDHTLGKKVYFRGLIEYSNICLKNCYYCGIRKDNREQNRYTMTDMEVLECAKFAHEMQYGSIVIQTGERSDEKFISKIEYLVREIKKLTNQELGITLSLGEQDKETYKKWFNAGAHRYLLRIETSNPELYSQIHPENQNFKDRVRTLYDIKNSGYQLGTGVMIGIPGQTIENLAEDILFFRELDVDMVGMGPYIEHDQTPLYKQKNILLPIKERFLLSLNMIAVLRLAMPDINIAATTAMQAIDSEGREKAIKAGANIVMPNLTPVKYRGKYMLYDGKPCLDEDASRCTGCLILRINSTGSEVALGEWGDSRHFTNKNQTSNFK